MNMPKPCDIPIAMYYYYTPPKNKYNCRAKLMIDGDKKVVSKQPFASFPKVNSLQS